MSTSNTLIKALALTAAVGFAAGCTPQTQLLTPGTPNAPVTMGLSGSDFAQAASDAVQSMLTSGAVDRNDGKKNIMVVSTVLNDTMQRIDTDQLVKKIRVDLLRSGKVLTTTAIGLNGAEDKMTQAYAELSQSRKIDHTTRVRQRLAAPNMSLSGKIIQRNNRVDGNKQLVEYYFQLTLTDLSNGLAIWEGETPIQKLGSAKGTSW
ncbi:MAG: penicillin-binding protein activator LpoB [Marinobacterium sp.]